MKTKAQKAEEIKLLKEKFERAKAVVFTGYKGLTVEEMSQMRRTLKAAEVEYKVVKNTLARIAAEGTPVGAAVEHITGPIGIAIGYDDPVIVAKKVQEYSKENEKFLIAGGVIEGRYLDPTLLKEVAKLPSRDVQLGMLAGAMSAPLTKMASLLKATIQNFGYALSALKEKKEQ